MIGSISNFLITIYQANFFFKSDPDFEMEIVPAIPIKNQYKKFAIRFSYRNRSAILRSKSITEFHFQIDQRLKTGYCNEITGGTQNRIQYFSKIFVTRSAP
jgi:hypothetical protein